MSEALTGSVHTLDVTYKTTPFEVKDVTGASVPVVAVGK